MTHYGRGHGQADQPDGADALRQRVSCALSTTAKARSHGRSSHLDNLYGESLMKYSNILIYEPLRRENGEAASEWLYGPWRKVLLAVGAAVIVLLLLRRRALAAAGPAGARANTTVALAMGSKVILTHPCKFSVQNHLGNIQRGV
jgi:hypothetical protein